MENEIWKDIEGYEGLYQASCTGKIKSVVRYVKMPNSEPKLKQESILVGGVTNSGYRYVNLTKHGKTKSMTVHRIVAKTFIENPTNQSCVAHLDDNKLNNSVHNLKWCSHSDNNQMAYDTGAKVGSFTGITGKSNPSSKPVYQYDMSGNLIKEWFCQRDITREIGISQGQISAVCTGRQKTARGFVWSLQKK